jgi:7-keto-8-aminopelargonate synthetase-like enzyme
MGGGFAEAFAVVGGLVLASSALSRITRRTILSTSVLAVGTGGTTVIRLTSAGRARRGR